VRARVLVCVFRFVLVMCVGINALMCACAPQSVYILNGVHASVCPSLRVFLSVCLSVCLSVYLYRCPYIHVYCGCSYTYNHARY
jgi:hypothetical protein